MNRKSGYTLVELLVAIVVIGILAGIVTVGYYSAVNSSKTAKTETDLGNIVQAINMAKAKTHKTLSEITKEYADSHSYTEYMPTYNSHECDPDHRAEGDEIINNLPDDDPCIVDSIITWDAIYAAAGIKPSQRPPKDAWGSPYLLDANENESMIYDGLFCSTDTDLGYAGTNDDVVKSVGPDGINVWLHTETSDDIWVDVPPDRIVCPDNL